MTKKEKKALKKVDKKVQKQKKGKDENLQQDKTQAINNVQAQ